MFRIMFQILMMNHISSSQDVRNTYSVYSFLGAGGFGSVYDGAHNATMQQVAIKFIGKDKLT